MPFTSVAGTSGVFISKALSNFAASFAQDLKGFAWDKLFNRKSVQQSQGLYPTFPSADWSRLVAGPRGPLEESKGGGFKAVWASYDTRPLQAVHMDIALEEVSDADPIMKLRQRAAEWCTEQLYMLLESKWATAYFAAASWDTSLAGANPVSNPATEFLKWTEPGSTPLKDVNAIKKAAHLASYGRKLNAGAMDYGTFMVLQSHPELKEQFKHTTSASIHLEIMKAYFDLEELIICEGISNTTQEGVAESPGYLTGATAGMLLVHRPKVYSETSPAAGATIWWDGMESSINGLQARIIPLPKQNGERVEVQVGAQMHKISSKLGGFLSGTI